MEVPPQAQVNSSPSTLTGENPGCQAMLYCLPPIEGGQHDGREMEVPPQAQVNSSPSTLTGENPGCQAMLYCLPPIEGGQHDGREAQTQVNSSP